MKAGLPVRIGGSHEEEQTTHASFIGQIDGVSVWNVALTEAEISCEHECSVERERTRLSRLLEIR